MDLISRCLSGDSEAFEELFEHHKNLVYRTAYLISGRADDAEDVLQDVFLRVYHSLGTYDASKAAFTTWLYRITVNMCLSRQRRRSPDSLPLLDSNARQPSPEAQIADAQALNQALDGLSEKLRAVVFLRYYAELSYTEISQVLEVPLGTVQSRLNAALHGMRLNMMPPPEEALGPHPGHRKGVTS